MLCEETIAKLISIYKDDDKILKTIENKEQETLMRINQRKNNSKKTDKNANGKITEKPW